MKNFFISYNSADNQWAQWIAWQLEEVGYTYLALHWDGNSLWVVDFEGARLSQCAPITTEGARYQPVRPNIG